MNDDLIREAHSLDYFLELHCDLNWEESAEAAEALGSACAGQ